MGRGLCAIIRHHTGHHMRHHTRHHTTSLLPARPKQQSALEAPPPYVLRPSRPRWAETRRPATRHVRIRCPPEVVGGARSAAQEAGREGCLHGGHLLREELDVGSSRKRFDFKHLRVLPADVEGLRADRAGRPQQRHIFARSIAVL